MTTAYDVTADLAVTSLYDLDTDTVQSNQAQMGELLQEVHPSIYVKRGVIFDYVLGPVAMFATAHSLFWQRVQISNSLLAISQDPELADPVLVQLAASNYRVTPQTGTQATGSVTVIVTADIPLAIPAGALFTSQGRVFQTVTAFAIRDSAALVQISTDRLLTLLNDGTYAFVIDVVAVNAGSIGNVAKNSVVAPSNAPPNFVRAYTTNDFSGGTDTQTNTSIIDKLLPGVAATALSGSVNMTAMLANNAKFLNVTADSVIGMGNVEMKRDKHSIFPGATGGKIDWYVQTQPLPQNLGLVKTATLVGVMPDGVSGVWQFTLDRDDAPGFYDIPAVTLPASANTTGGFQIVSQTFAIDMSPLDNDGFLPDIATALEGRFSRFQTAVVTFIDTATPLANLTLGQSQQAYAVTVRALPLLADLQDMVSAQGTRNPMGDCLVRAPVPCFVKLSFTLRLPSGQAAPNLNTMAVALSQAVNTRSVAGVLPASLLSDVVQSSLSGGAYVDAIDMLGKLQRPDGTWRLLRSTEALNIPDEAEQGVSPRTTVFFLSPADVTIAVRTS